MLLFKIACKKCDWNSCSYEFQKNFIVTRKNKGMAERFIIHPWMIILVGAIVLLIAPLAKLIGAAAVAYGVYLYFIKPYHDSQKSPGAPPAEAELETEDDIAKDE